MRKIVLASLITIIVVGIVNIKSMENDLRFIEVKGSAEISVDPDEIRFQIGIEEYWKEEFEKGKEYKEYVKKIPLEKIEKKLMSSLTEIGISKNQIIIKEIGQHRNRSGKDFKKSKMIELVLTDFSKVDEILTKVNVKGINSMRISELKNKDITNYREQVKIEAMKAAKKKAGYLLKSVDEELGRVISVIELDDHSGYFWKPQNSLSNSVIPSSNGDNNDENMKKTKLKYEIKIRFEIK